MIRLSLSVAVYCMLLIPALAGDDEHLVPEDSVFSEHQPRKTKQHYDDYEENVLRFFNEAFDRSVFARVVVLPSFSPEYVIAISSDDADYKLLYLETDVQLWPFEDLEEAQAREVEASNEAERRKAREVIQDLRSYIPESRDQVPLNRCEYALPLKVGEGLHRLWGEMLFRTRYPDRRPITIGGDGIMNVHVDGTSYHFSFEYDHTRLTGKTWSPEEGSINGKFVAVTDRLRQGCVDIKADFFDTLDGEIQSLLSDLEKTLY